MLAIYEQDGIHEVVMGGGKRTILVFNDSKLGLVIKALISQDFLFETELLVLK